MKKLACLIILFTYPFLKAQQQVGINTTSPHSSAVLEINSPNGNQGLLLPRLNASQIQALSSTAAKGLVVYDTTNDKFLGWDGSKWQNLGFEIVNNAPVANTVNFTGSMNQGQVLSGTFTYSDTENDSQGNSIFLWRTADNNTGSNAQIIAGANTQSYTLTSSDIGKYIQFCVTPIAISGTLQGNETCSSYKGPALSSLLTGLVAYENFGTTAGGFTSLSNNGFGFSGSGTGLTFENTNGANPASLRAVSDYGLQKLGSSTNSGATITSGLMNASNYTNNLELSLRLASFSITGTNGADGGDYVLVSIDTGNGYSDELKITGNNNTRWDFSTGNTGIASAVFDGDNTPTSIGAPSTGLSTGANALTNLKISNIPNTIKGVKILIFNNDNNEQWVIDEIKLMAQ